MRKEGSGLGSGCPLPAPLPRVVASRERESIEVTRRAEPKTPELEFGVAAESASQCERVWVKDAHKLHAAAAQPAHEARMMTFSAFVAAASRKVS